MLFVLKKMNIYLKNFTIMTINDFFNGISSMIVQAHQYNLKYTILKLIKYFGHL